MVAGYALEQVHAEFFELIAPDAREHDLAGRAHVEVDRLEERVGAWSIRRRRRRNARARRRGRSRIRKSAYACVRQGGRAWRARRRGRAICAEPRRRGRGSGRRRAPGAGKPPARGERLGLGERSRELARSPAARRASRSAARSSSSASTVSNGIPASASNCRRVALFEASASRNLGFQRSEVMGPLMAPRGLNRNCDFLATET